MNNNDAFDRHVIHNFAFSFFHTSLSSVVVSHAVVVIVVVIIVVAVVVIAGCCRQLASERLN